MTGGTRFYPQRKHGGALGAGELDKPLSDTLLWS